MQKDNEDRKFLDDLLKKNQTLREKERFAGINYQFLLIEEKMLKDFERTNSIKHPGDKGASRESFLRLFFNESGYLPEKFSISEGSSHIISTSGHISDQIDLLFYDSLNSPKLLNMDTIQYFPVESVYGVVEVKSNLNSKNTVFDALNKIKSFKSLKYSFSNQHEQNYSIDPSINNQGFGIIFAYESSLKWGKIFDYIEEFQKENPSSVWPNLIVVLNQGTICQLKEIKHNSISKVGVYSTKTISTLEEINLGGNPKHHSNLLEFYLTLIDLLNNINLPIPPLRKYVDLNRPVGKYTYNFGMMSGLLETGTCEKHGDYLRKVSDKSLEKITTACLGKSRISWYDVISLVVKDKDMSVSKKKEILLYNPDDFTLEDVLINPDNKSFLFDELIINYEKYWIPHYYSHKEELITNCPKCKS